MTARTSASIKTYIDHWSAWMRVPGLPFKDEMAKKTLRLITTSGDRSKAQINLPPPGSSALSSSRTGPCHDAFGEGRQDLLNDAIMGMTKLGGPLSSTQADPLSVDE